MTGNRTLAILVGGIDVCCSISFHRGADGRLCWFYYYYLCISAKFIDNVNEIEGPFKGRGYEYVMKDVECCRVKCGNMTRYLIKLAWCFSVR
jgi:hypothetical protein